MTTIILTSLLLLSLITIFKTKKQNTFLKKKVTSLNEIIILAEKVISKQNG